MRNFLTCYTPRYVRSLTYMLQASEYYTLEYLAWFHRTKNFGRVEYRKHVVWTSKARITYGLFWLIAAIWFGVLAFLHAYLPTHTAVAVVVVGLVLTPYVLAYGIVVPLALMYVVVQRPIEFFAIRKAKKKLRTHRGIKIAIAGSFGKTSMREILRAVVGAGKRVASPPGSHNTPLAICAFIEKLTGDEEVLLFEFGEYYQGDVKFLSEFIQPDIGFITGVNEAHLERFKTLDQTTRTIFELADFLKAAPTYVNSESVHVGAAARTGHVRYSRDGVGGWRVTGATSDLTGTRVTLNTDSGELELYSHLLGLHNVGPLVAAAHCAHKLGLTNAQIVDGVAATKPFEHRLELKTDTGGVVTLDDSYNGNPDGVSAVIDFVASLSGHKRIYVTPGLVEMGARSPEVHRAIGAKLAAAHIEQVVLIRNSVTPYIAEGLTAAGYTGTLTWYDDALQAYAALPHLTVSGDVVVLQNDWPDQYA